MKKKREIKVPKNFFRGLKFKIDVPKIAELHEWCPLCRKWRDDYIKRLLPPQKSKKTKV